MDLRVDGVVEHHMDGITRNEDDLPPPSRPQRARGALAASVSLKGVRV